MIQINVENKRTLQGEEIIQVTAKDSNGQTLGHIVGGIQKPAAFIDNIQVSPIIRSQGLGSRLVGTFALQATSLGCSHIVVDSFRPEAPTQIARLQQFYSNNNFDRFGEVLVRFLK